MEEVWSGPPHPIASLTPFPPAPALSAVALLLFLLLLFFPITLTFTLTFSFMHSLILVQRSQISAGDYMQRFLAMNTTDYKFVDLQRTVRAHADPLTGHILSAW